MPTPADKGYVDYVLWGDDGRPLAGGGEAHRAGRPGRPAAGEALRRLPGGACSGSGR